jgi:hypothetical protein
MRAPNLTGLCETQVHIYQPSQHQEAPDDTYNLARHARTDQWSLSDARQDARAHFAYSTLLSWQSLADFMIPGRVA